MLLLRLRQRLPSENWKIIWLHLKLKLGLDEMVLSLQYGVNGIYYLQYGAKNRRNKINKSFRDEDKDKDLDNEEDKDEEMK